MEHTQGPWELVILTSPLEDWSASRFVIRSEQAPGGIAFTIGGVGAEEEANARLIVAAPELLKALRAISNLPAHPMRKKSLEMALVAIAKAEGL